MLATSLLVLGLAAFGSQATSLELEFGVLSPREVGYWCGCDYIMNDKGLNTTYNDLVLQINEHPTIPAGKSISSFTADDIAVSFICNLSDKPFVPSSALADVRTGINKNCGEFIAGTWQVQSGVYMGYMEYQPGLDFCGDALNAPVGDCCTVGSDRFIPYRACILKCIPDSGPFNQTCMADCAVPDPDCAHPANEEYLGIWQLLPRGESS